MERTNSSLSLIFLKKSLGEKNNITVLVSEMANIRKLTENNVKIYVFVREILHTEKTSWMIWFSPFNMWIWGSNSVHQVCGHAFPAKPFLQPQTFCILCRPMWHGVLLLYPLLKSETIPVLRCSIQFRHLGYKQSKGKK